MSLSRLQQLCRFIRFDDSRTRMDRLRQDKLAPFRYVWEMFFGIAHDLIMRLAKDFLYLGANLTLDNFFVSYKLAETLIEKETTITGTIRSNKREQK